MTVLISETADGITEIALPREKKVTTIVVTLSNEDRVRGGWQYLPAVTHEFLHEQFGLNVAICVQDEAGNVLVESVPLGTIRTIGEPTIVERPPNTPGIIGN